MNTAARIVSQGFLYLITLPINIVGWLTVLVCRLAWGQDLKWKDNVLTMTFKSDSWMMKNWYKNWGGSTIGHAVIMAPADEFGTKHVWNHELVHVEQMQAGGLLGFILALCVAPFCWWLAIIIWAVTPSLSYLCGSLVSLIRGETFYKGNTNEESARAQQHAKMNNIDFG